MNPLPWTDASHRAGLLLGAVLFLAKGAGLPWSHGLFGVAALPLAALMVATASLSWKQLGDWRDPRRGALILASVLPVWIVVAAAVTPELGATALPDELEKPAAAALGTVMAMPFAALAVGAARGLISLFHLLVLMAATYLAWRPGSFMPATLAAGLSLALLLLYHPAMETWIGAMFLAWFFWVGRERALMLPIHVERVLDPHDTSFLLHLGEAGRVAPGEVALLLPRGGARLAELGFLGLVRESEDGASILPGHALGREEPRAASRRGWLGRAAWIAFGALYLLFPDLLPGPVDDLVVMLLCSYAGFRTPGRELLNTESASGSS